MGVGALTSRFVIPLHALGALEHGRSFKCGGPRLREQRGDLGTRASPSRDLAHLAPTAAWSMRDGPSYPAGCRTNASMDSPSTSVSVLLRNDRTLRPVICSIGSQNSRTVAYWKERPGIAQ